ncbi:hypothetical protein SAMN05216312_11092 [Cohnella sp. OV330]|uniref:hypothetical protein n=1 Tax=Cohnella sp. OV330 TaxID=1855288 RepID=UPI0008E69496|nr:hypothetical protein [Cohnella sp. OV330]SFB49506.1 hypothetical protein SAMN05216312_11092 [Cohnella sp. OV330]
MLALLFLALIAFLAYDWTAGRLGGAKLRIKIVYAVLLLAAGYHLLIVTRTITAASYYDLSMRIFGGIAERIVAYLDPKGGT